MDNQNETAQDILLDVKIAEASRLFKFYLRREKAILGGSAVIIFLTIWELVGNVFQLINPMFMSAPSLIFKAGVQLFSLRGRSTTTCISAAPSFSAAISFRLLLPFPSASWSAGTKK